MCKFILYFCLLGTLLIVLFSSCNQPDKKGKKIEGKNEAGWKDSAFVYESKKSKHLSKFWEKEHPVLVVGNTSYEITERDFEKDNFGWITVELNAPGLLGLTNDNPDKKLPNPKVRHRFFIEFDTTGQVTGFNYRLNGHNYGSMLDTISGKIDTFRYGSGLYFCEVDKSYLLHREKGDTSNYATYIPEYSRKLMLWDLSKFPPNEETVYSKTIETALVRTGIPDLLKIHQAILAELDAARIARSAETNNHSN